MQVLLGQLGCRVGSPNVCHHVGVIPRPRLGKAKVAQLDHGRLTVVQQGVVQLQVSAVPQASSDASREAEVLV